MHCWNRFLAQSFTLASTIMLYLCKLDFEIWHETVNASKGEVSFTIEKKTSCV